MAGNSAPDVSGTEETLIKQPSVNDAAVVLVSFPHQLLHALCALHYERRLCGIREDAPATILVWSYRPSHHTAGSKFRELMALALQGFPWAKLCFPTRLERTFHLSPYRRLIYRAAWLRNKLGATAFRSCYFSHDASADHTAQALMQAYPAAKHICYGDPPGFLYPALSSVASSHFPRTALKQLFWKSRLRGLPGLLHASVSIIAVDFRSPAEVLQPQEVYLLPRALLLDTLRILQAGLRHYAPEIAAWTEENATDSAPRYLLLLSNFSDSGMTTRQNEQAMYAEICRTHVPSGSTIYLKPHIGTGSGFISGLISSLADYDVVGFPATSQQVPVELFPELLTRTHVLSVSSSSALIAHLIGHSITHALTDELIRRHFRPGYVNYMIEANRAIAEKTTAAAKNASFNHGSMPPITLD